MADFDPLKKQEIFNNAVSAQHQAADPDQSVWVSANAGTGKTRVLTSRILRLLINGAEVADILAVTYTRAAAAEMRNRLFEILARWAVIDETDLTHDIKNMGIPRPSQDQIKRARQLFAHLLDQPSGVRIETVHAFAQSVLRRFPLEAGVQPYFELATEDQIRIMKTEAQTAMLLSSDALVRQSLLSLGQQVAEYNLAELTSEMFKFPHLLAMAERDPAALKAKIFKALDCGDAAENPEDGKRKVIETAINGMPKKALQDMVRRCIDGGKIEQQVAHGLEQWLGFNHEKQVENFDLYAEVLLTKKGGIRSQFPSKKTISSYPKMLDEFVNEASRIRGVLQQINAISSAQTSFDLYIVAAAMATGYHRRKVDKGLMDYDDLINQTISLLDQDGGASWVRYKLDRGLKYLLVDEAQDTSPSQWKILTAIADEFFQETEEDRQYGPDRSIFSVGDFKQSIYSFQGARPELFDRQKDHFERQAARAQKPFRQVPLNTSFRTAAPILKLVDQVAELQGDDAGLGALSQHPVARLGDAGFVEILDPIVEDKSNDGELEPFTPMDSGQSSNVEQHLAEEIAAILKSWIGTRILPSQNRVMRAGDILILLRKREGFGMVLDRELRLAGLPLAGADRVKLLDHIAVMDLIALGQVMLLPEDDLSLASVLKSPLIGLDEDQLFDLAHDRGEASLMQQLAKFAAEEDDVYLKAHSQILAWMGSAETQSPYDFYHDVLSSEGRINFIKRLGTPVVDILAEFLNIARDFEAIHPPSLQLFLEMIRHSDLQVTRDGNAPLSDEIRIMTIHGAKGLEAPVVVLPDMLAGRLHNDPLVMIDTEDGSLPIKAVAAPSSPQHELITQSKDLAKLKAQEEENRLLYVALTRAEDGLLIGGFESSRKRKREDSWYQRCRDALEQIEGWQERPDGNGVQLITAQTAPVKDQLAPVTTAGETEEFTSPDWLDRPAPIEETPPRPLSPSRYRISDHAGSPSGQDRQMAMLRGTITHRLLEILPQLPPEAQDRAAARIFAPHQPTPLNTEMAESIRRDVDALLINPDLGMIFDGDARVEVPISGRIGKHIVSGVIDRLLVREDEVMIIDFKTGQPPENHDGISRDYVTQLAIYRHVLAEIYPKRLIKAGLIYTENAALHWMADQAMDIVIDGLLSSTS